jgi:hypothetical protein
LGGPVISWIVASHDQQILQDNLLTDPRALAGESDEVILEWQAPSIAAAYNSGQARASRPVRVFVHHDVRILDLPRLRTELLKACTRSRGVVGVIGTPMACWPWWEAPVRCGSVQDARLGHLDFSRGGEPAAMVDGLLLATAQEIAWDESFEGWHGYDHDACMSQLAAGRVNYCIPDGDRLVLHNRVTDTSPVNTDMIPGWAAAEARFRSKWGSS